MTIRKVKYDKTTDGAQRASPWHQVVSPIRFANGGA